jgi:hypothetical protein
MMVSQIVKNPVTPAEAGVQNYLISLDSRFLGNNKLRLNTTFYELIKFNPIK